ncbi:hypothetical protein BVC80_209g171 [Macleaya cordata]|uniref:Uncharacterized protein n=1 Tax=Macleaya cordata TaxID=56857 RepID=A0A200QD74_MACCD|nr:hypothetical protein BVC80_209g171 [Macleaya cordata]
MTESRKRPESDEEELFGATEKRQRTPMISDEDYDVEDFLAEFWSQEQTVMEVMKVLEEEITTTCPNPSISFLSSTPASSSFVTINGNEETCGPSFSNSASTVMASIYFAGNNNIINPYLIWDNGVLHDWSLRLTFLLDRGFLSLPDQAITVKTEKNGEEDESCGGGGGDQKEINGSCDLDQVEESDDEWIERVLSEIPFGFEEGEEEE